MARLCVTYLPSLCWSSASCALLLLPCAPQDEYGRRWTELEQLPGAAEEPLGREGISAAALHLCTIHVQRQRGAGNEFADLERLQQVRARVHGLQQCQHAAPLHAHSRSNACCAAHGGTRC